MTIVIITNAQVILHSNPASHNNYKFKSLEVKKITGNIYYSDFIFNRNFSYSRPPANPLPSYIRTIIHFVLNQFLHFKQKEVL